MGLKVCRCYSLRYIWGNKSEGSFNETEKRKLYLLIYIGDDKPSNDRLAEVLARYEALLDIVAVRYSPYACWEYYLKLTKPNR